MTNTSPEQADYEAFEARYDFSAAKGVFGHGDGMLMTIQEALETRAAAAEVVGCPPETDPVKDRIYLLTAMFRAGQPLHAVDVDFLELYTGQD